MGCGGLGATPVINHPEGAIMGVHNILKEPRFDADDNIVPASVMGLPSGGTVAGHL